MNFLSTRRATTRSLVSARMGTSRRERPMKGEPSGMATSSRRSTSSLSRSIWSMNSVTVGRTSSLARRRPPIMVGLVVEFVDAVFHPSLPEALADDALDQEGGEARLEIRHRAQAGEDDAHGDAAREADLPHPVHLAEADRGDRVDGHVHGLAEAPPPA